MANTYKTLASGQLADSSTTIYTVPGSTKCVSPSLRLFNTGGTVETVKVHFDTGTSRQQVQLDIPPLGYADHPFNKTVLEAGYLIKAQSTTAATVNYFLSGVEIS